MVFAVMGIAQAVRHIMVIVMVVGIMAMATDMDVNVAGMAVLPGSAIVIDRSPHQIKMSPVMRPNPPLSVRY